MSGRFVRQSKYRHVVGREAKPDASYCDIPKISTMGEGNYIAANNKYLACMLEGGGGPIMILDHKDTGRISKPPKLNVHKARVWDLAWNPFADNVLATASDDCHINLTVIPDDGVKHGETLTEAAATLEGHGKRATLVQWHPTANNILCSASYDWTLKVWDAESQAEVLSYDDHSDVIQSFDWNTDGSLLATTSKDKFLRIYDLRSTEEVIKVERFKNPKSSKVKWVDNHGKLFTVGFGRDGTRRYRVWDPKHMEKPLVDERIDSAGSVLVPFYDPDTSIMYLSGKGDGTIRYYEFVTDEPYLHELSAFGSNVPHKSVCFLPKTACNTLDTEIGICLRLKRDGISPVSFKVPRRSDVFSEEIFPDTYAGIPSITAEDWLKGGNAPPKLRSMKPGEHQEGPKKAFKVGKSPAQLKEELAAAHKRIEELEAEVARLKAQ